MVVENRVMALKSPSQKRDRAIVLCADRKYFPPAYVVCSALAKAWRSEAKIFLLTEPGPHLDRLPANIPFEVRTPQFSTRLPHLPEVMEKRGAFTYLRMFLPELVPGYRRIIYLDSDIRIAGSIDPLFQLDLKGAPFAAVDDLMKFHPPSIALGTPHRLKLGMKEGDSYFNSGVVLIDCEMWQQKQMTNIAIDCMARLGPLAVLNDQDVLNVAFCNEWLPLSPRWNFPPSAFESDVERAVQPVVLHHIFQKAWNSDEPNWRERKLFESAIRKTPYRDFVTRRRSYSDFKRAAEWRVKRAFQDATFFLPSSRRRISGRTRIASAGYAAYIVTNIQSRRFADCDQGISVFDMAELCAAALKERGAGF